MTLQSSGQITMANLASEFSQSDSEGLLSYYRGGGVVPATRTVTGTATKNTNGETNDFASVSGLTVRRSNVSIGASTNTGTSSDTTVAGIDVDVTTGQSWTRTITGFEISGTYGRAATINFGQTSGTWSTNDSFIRTESGLVRFTAENAGTITFNGSPGHGTQSQPAVQFNNLTGPTPGADNGAEIAAGESFTLNAGENTILIRSVGSGGYNWGFTFSGAGEINYTSFLSANNTFNDSYTVNQSALIMDSEEDMTNGVTITFQNQNPYSVALSSTSTGGDRTLPASQSSGTTVQDGTSNTGNTSSNWTVASANINDTGSGDGYAGGFGVTVADGTDIAAHDSGNRTGDDADEGGFAVDSTSTTTYGSLTTSSPANSGSFTVTNVASVSYVQVTQGGRGNHTVVQSGTQRYSQQQDDLPTTTIYWRGPAWQSGDGGSNAIPYNSTPTGIQGTGNVAFNGFTNAVIARRTPTTTHTITFTNNNDFTVTTNNNATGGALEYVADQQRTVTNAGSSATWRLAYDAIDRYDITMQNNNNTSTAVAANTTGEARTFTAGQSVQVADDALDSDWTIAFGSATAYTYAAKNGTGVDGTANNVTILASDSDSFTNFDSNNSSASLSVTWSSTEQINEGVPRNGPLALHDFYGATAT